MWYTTFGASITIIVALLGTLVFGKNNPNKVDPVLLTPCIRKFFAFGFEKPMVSLIDLIKYISGLFLCFPTGCLQGRHSTSAQAPSRRGGLV